MATRSPTLKSLTFYPKVSPTYCPEFYAGQSTHRTNRSNDTNGLVPGNQGELGDKFAFVDMLGSRSSQLIGPPRDALRAGERGNYQVCIVYDPILAGSLSRQLDRHSYPFRKRRKP